MTREEAVECRKARVESMYETTRMFEHACIELMRKRNLPGPLFTTKERTLLLAAERLALKSAKILRTITYRMERMR